MKTTGLLLLLSCLLCGCYYGEKMYADDYVRVGYQDYWYVNSDGDSIFVRREVQIKNLSQQDPLFTIIYNENSDREFWIEPRHELIIPHADDSLRFFYSYLEWEKDKKVAKLKFQTKTVHKPKVGISTIARLKEEERKKWDYGPSLLELLKIPTHIDSTTKISPFFMDEVYPGFWHCR